MTINCKGRLIDLNSPKIMGILNITPDSFYDGGKYKDEAAILRRTDEMLEQDATFIDVGAYSSRPGADHISEDEELRRIENVLSLLINRYPEILISVDTFRSKIARFCLEAGASMINDISGGELDAAMMKTVAQFNAPYIMMHMRGTPQTMTQHTAYEDLLKEVIFALSEKVAKARQLKINDIIIDPGFGFAKTREQNFLLLRYMNLLQSFELPILVGLSRKSMIYKTLGTDADQALNGTTALHMYALVQGAHILRVHDVKEASECVQLFKAIHSS